MPELKPKMFRESEKSSVSENLVANIVSFILIMVLILIAESFIPWLMAKDAINERIREYTLSGASLKLSTIRDISATVVMENKVFIVTLLCTVFGTLISMLYCRLGEARSLRSMGVVKRKAGIHYLQGLLVGALLMSFISLGSVVFRVSNISLCKNINFGMILLIFVGFIVQGMSEEFIFRGFFMNTLGGRHHPFVAIGVSAVAFSLAHFLNPGYGVLVFINLAMFGVFASLYMIAFDDIWGACAMHSIWNFLQGSFFGISVSGTGTNESIFRMTAKSSSKLLTGGDFGIEGSIFTTLALAAGIAVVCWRLSKAPTTQNEE